MPDLVTVSHVLQQPVQYNGQTYFTSQYFHQQYLANSQAVGKYQRHADFLRLLRSMESYTLYVQREDIVELAWIGRGKIADADSAFVNKIKHLENVFREIHYNPLVLLNATAQVAMSFPSPSPR